MSEPQDLEASRDSSADADQAARFHFPITWSTLVDPGALASRHGLPVVRPPSPQQATDPSVQWSMVVPKMAQLAAALALPAPASAQAAQFAGPRYAAPRFEVSLDSASLAVKVILSAALIMLLIPGWQDTGSPGARAIEIESTMAQANWVRGASPIPRHAELLLYRPSLKETDYRLEFNWIANPRGLIWGFRVQDNENYYGVRIKPAGSRILSVEHFVMYHGAERSRASKLVTLTAHAVPVRMDVAGSSFKIYLDGNPVSQWTDARLPAGGLGFIDDGGNRTEVQALRISFPGKS